MRWCVLFLFTCPVMAWGQDSAPVAVAQALRKTHPVPPSDARTVIAEAEEFQIVKPGWRAKAFGTNYYAATFANAFLSRKAYLGAPEQCAETTANLDVLVPKAGRYLALVRYEAAYRFETQFRLRIEQGGKVRLDRLYGARDNVKIWAFGKKLQKEVAWDWGAGENVVWEGHDAVVELEAGKARLTLLAGKQPGDAARRNVDLVMLTSDEEQVKTRIAKENYLPLDGMLTQAGDVHLRVHNARESSALTLNVPAGTEHSPYWVHIRNWKPIAIKAEPGQSTEWFEVGQLLDTLSDGQWNLTAAGKGPLQFDVEIGVRQSDGTIAVIRRLEKQTGNVALAYYGDTRYRRQIRTADEVLFDLLAALKKQSKPVGKAPRRTLLFGYTFDRRPGNERYNSGIDEFIRLIGATALQPQTNEGGDLNRGYIDVRGVPTPKLEEYCKKLQTEGKAGRIAVVSLGDEIGLARPPAKDDAGFRAWLKSRGIQPKEVDPSAADYDKLPFSLDAATAKTQPGVFYYSHLYAYRYGIRQLKERTDILRKHLPAAGVGANFSPHHGAMYLGSTHQWISLFREDGMTMPWGEDYIFQVPMGSPQVNFLMVDMFRAALRPYPDRKIHFYVMPHGPNNTPAGWRRQFYGDIAHGVKVFNLFEFRPVQAAYTENHVSDLNIFQAVRQGFHELGQFEDIVQDGHVRPGQAALWFSEAGDVWNDLRSPYDAAKRSLYLAIRHAQAALDVVVEGDELKPYRVLYLTDAHVGRSASKSIAAWVRGGGKLFATANAGMFDELNQPNETMRALLGVTAKEVKESKEVIRFEKQDLPFAEPLDTVTFKDKTMTTVYGMRAGFGVQGADVLATFADGSPAVSVRKEGEGQAVYCGFLPGLSYLKPALPKRPWDRGSTDDSMTHFLPTDFDKSAAALIARPLGDVRSIRCSEALVETTVLESKHGIVIPLVNWTGKRIKNLSVVIPAEIKFKTASLASGGAVKVGKAEVSIDLDVADALILR